MSDSIFDHYPAVRYVDEFERDTDPLCIKCKGNCGFIGMVGYWACQGFIPKKNRDKLSRMSNKELAEWFQSVCTASSECSCCDCKFYTLDECTFEKWLGQEVE